MTPDDASVPLPPGGEPCRCGHPRALHRHYRAGTDCAACGPQVCRRYRSAEGLLRRAGRLLGRRPA